jgi:hypothetical protein
MMTVCAAMLWVLLPLAAPCAGTETKQESWEDYTIITQRNIFSRTRRAKIDAPAATVNRAPVAVRTEESYLVLRGVVLERGVHISFIEDSRTGAVTKARAGEAVGGGALADVTLDYISYNLKGADIRVAIGSTLEGKVPETSSSAYYSGGGYYSNPVSYETQQTVQPAEQTAVSEDEAKDILQRLKERRKKELGE